MIYIDHPRSFSHKRKQYSHMMGDTIEELHAFAQSNNIGKHWFHKDHYDVPIEKFYDLVVAGAKLVTSRELVQLRRRLQK